jgi:cytochrome c2
MGGDLHRAAMPAMNGVGKGETHGGRGARRALSYLRAGVLPIVLVCGSGCGSSASAREAMAMTGGDPSRAPVLLRQYGCASCHDIPGVTGAHGLVGPPLGGIARRSYIAGVLTNDAKHMVRWIRDPRGVDSLTAMPNTGVTENDARDIAAYLYTLR